MKHQAITLLKFKLLASRLTLPLWQTIGLLEGLWLFAMHNARNGDLSNFQPFEVAAWLEYEGDAAAMVKALIETRWLDQQGDLLIIHDWSDHKPTWLKGVEARQLSTEPSPQLSNGLSTEPSHPLTKPKSGTKQVRVRVSGSSGIGTADGKKQFVKPTVEEVSAYCRERKNGIDAQDFVDHYATVGWVVGRNRSPMRDWKSAVRTWEARRRKELPSAPAERVATTDDLQSWNPGTGANQ